FDATTKNPFEKLGTYFWNFAWITGNGTPWVEDLTLFVGYPEDIVDSSYGVFLPNARKQAKKHYQGGGTTKTELAVLNKNFLYFLWKSTLNKNLFLID
ncbi:hypothetical protein, partial [Neobacillus vireti]